VFPEIDTFFYFLFCSESELGEEPGALATAMSGLELRAHGALGVAAARRLQRGGVDHAAQVNVHGEARRHHVLHVHHLHKRLHASALCNRALRHTTNNLQQTFERSQAKQKCFFFQTNKHAKFFPSCLERGSVNSSNNKVRVGTILGARLICTNNHSLVSSIAPIEQNDNLALLQAAQKTTVRSKTKDKEKKKKKKETRKLLSKPTSPLQQQASESDRQDNKPSSHTHKR
jgi:hypothetical protein